MSTTRAGKISSITVAFHQIFLLGKRLRAHTLFSNASYVKSIDDSVRELAPDLLLPFVFLCSCDIGPFVLATESYDRREVSRGN